MRIRAGDVSAVGRHTMGVTVMEVEAGDTFSYWIRARGGADDVTLGYGTQSADSEYRVKVDAANDGLFLSVYEGGSGTELASQGNSFTLDGTTGSRSRSSGEPTAPTR